MGRTRRKRTPRAQRQGTASTPAAGGPGDRLALARKKYGLEEILAPVQAAGLGRGTGLVNLSQFDAANGSDRRGWIYHPNLDTRKDLDQYSREEMVRQSRWLQDNVGFAGRCVEGLAEMIGYLLPNAATDDTTWNETAERHFLERCLVPEVFDRAGKLDFCQWQVAISRDKLGDGDCLTVLTEAKPNPKDPEAKRPAQVAYYESHQIRSGTRQRSIHRKKGKSPESQYEEIDGVMVHKRTGRRAGYFLQDDAGDAKARPRLVSARDVIFCSNPTRHGRVRGVTALHRAVNHLVDTTEITASVKSAIKTAADVVYQIVASGDKNALPFHPAQGLAREIEVEADGTIKEAGEGTATAQKVRIEDLLGMPVAMQLDNRRLEMVHDARPHPNQVDFINNYLARDIAWGVGVASEILWMFNGESSPGIRFRMDEFRRWLAMRQESLRRVVQRYWVYFWAKEFARGYPMPKAENWWACDWVPQADLTIDHGRDGKLELSRLEAGADSHTDIYRRRGKQASDAFRTRARDIRTAEDIAEQELGDRTRWREVYGKEEEKEAPELEPRMPA